MISITVLAFSTVTCILLKDTIDPVLLAMVFSYVLSLHGSMIGFFHCMGDLEKKMVGIQRCLQILEIPQEKREQKQIQDKQWPSQGCIEFDDVQVRYRPTTEKVLKGLSFKIEGGHKIGIVGRTGAGKSTISLALTRIIEMESGRILIDGQSIGEHSIEQLREKITIIPQDPTLFTGTLRFNVDPDNKATDEEILELLQKAGLSHLTTRESSSTSSKADLETGSSGSSDLLGL